MRSITRTLMISLSLTAISIFVAAVLTVSFIQANKGSPDRVCETVVRTIAETISLSHEPGAQIVITPTLAFADLRDSSPGLWFFASSGPTSFEFNRSSRPVLPFSLPYDGLMTRATLRTPDGVPPACLKDVPMKDGAVVTLIIAGSQPRLLSSMAIFIKDELSVIAMVGAAFAAIVAAGVVLAGRFVSRSIADVTRMAVAIDPAAPQGSIPLEEIPAELQVLVKSLNSAFDEIAAFMDRQRRFLRNAAHELRTPLAILRSKLEEVSDPKQRAALVLDTRRLTSLVSAMLDLARLKEAGLRRVPVDLAEITRDVLADYSPLALDQSMELSLLSDSDKPVIVLGSAAAIRSAIANLVGNALVHAYGATSILARLEKTGAVSICDDGSHASKMSCRVPGIRGDGTKVPAGTGLGLSIIREIMDAHQGTLTVMTVPGRGTTARLDFYPSVSADSPIQRNRFPSSDGLRSNARRSVT